MAVKATRQRSYYILPGNMESERAREPFTTFWALQCHLAVTRPWVRNFLKASVFWFKKAGLTMFFCFSLAQEAAAHPARQQVLYRWVCYRYSYSTLKDLHYLYPVPITNVVSIYLWLAIGKISRQGTQSQFLKSLTLEYHKLYHNLISWSKNWKTKKISH